LTSKYMTEALERACRDRNLTVFDSFRAVKVLTEDGICRGIVCISPCAVSEDNPAGITVVLAGAVVWAVGGPSAVYSGSVYPESQNCSLGAALLAGAEASNLTESQYGIASLAFRWNLSGSYQQVIPRYVSVDENGVEREFLTSYFAPGELAEAVFLKGYEWPFDPSKIRSSPEHRGSRSSEVDIAVYREVTQGRRVYLDFRRNPSVIDENGLNASGVGDTAYEYLKNCNALGDTPIVRLRQMNERAYRLYLDHGIDLEGEMLEISVCAQHLNGGLSVTIDYESPTLENFYPCGECAGVFGVKRPGGSALNSTQVSSSRAADAIAAKNIRPTTITPVLTGEIAEISVLADMLDPENGDDIPKIIAERTADGKKHDECAAFLRDRDKITVLLAETAEKIRTFRSRRAKSHAALTEMLITYDTLVTRYAMLSAISAYIADGGKSRGSYLITSSDGIDTEHRGFVLNTSVACEAGIISASSSFEAVRPIPQVFNWFENVYNAN
ncbi:MAG: FAD-binding protein, partial [Clostridia bacterium]|nr:FAD-binding protein [Clostridia bacterium]